MRNLLCEFDAPGKGKGAPPVPKASQTALAFRAAAVYAAEQTPPVALVGFREWIFSGNVRSEGHRANAEQACGDLLRTQQCKLLRCSLVPVAFFSCPKHTPEIVVMSACRAAPCLSLRPVLNLALALSYSA